MDKVKIKNMVSEVEVILAELVMEGKLDGNQKQAILFSISERVVNKEIDKALEVV